MPIKVPVHCPSLDLEYLLPVSNAVFLLPTLDCEPGKYQDTFGQALCKDSGYGYVPSQASGRATSRVQVSEGLGWDPLQSFFTAQLYASTTTLTSGASVVLQYTWMQWV